METNEFFEVVQKVFNEFPPGSQTYKEQYSAVYFLQKVQTRDISSV